MPPYLRGLELTEQQRDKIFEITYAQVPAMRAKGKEARKAREALRELTSSGQYDEAKVRALAETEAQAMTEMTVLRTRTDNAVLQVLTPEQRKTAQAMKVRFKADRAGGERGGPERGGPDRGGPDRGGPDRNGPPPPPNS